MRIKKAVWDRIKHNANLLQWDYDRMSTSGQEAYEQLMDDILITAQENSHA